MPVQVHASAGLSCSPRRAARHILFILLSCVLSAGPLAGQDDKESPALEEGTTIQRELGGGQPHSYRVELAAGQFLHATVRQQSVDVVVSVFAPGGQKLADVDNPASRLGQESVSLVAEAPGSYRLEVRPYDRKAAAGRYEIRLDARHAATAADRLRLSAEKGFAESYRLAKAAKTPEARSQAGDRLEENASLWRQLGDKYWEALALDTLADTRRAQDQPEQALTLLGRAQALYVAVGDRRGEAGALYDIGVIHYERREYAEALSFFNKALPLWQALGSRQTVAYTRNYLGLAYQKTREYASALGEQNQALQLMRELKNREGEARTLGYIGEVYRFQRETGKALENYNEALKYWRSVNNLAWQASVLYDIGAAYDEADEDGKAVEPYTQALELYRQLKDRRNEAATLYAIGTTYDELRDRQKALETLNQALAIRRELNDTAWIGAILYYIGTVHNDMGDRQKALELLTEALPLHRAAADRHREARTLNYMGDIHLVFSQREQAQKHYQDALTIRREINDRRGEVDTLNNLGLIYTLGNKADDAIRSFTDARKLAQTADYPEGEGQALNGLGNVHQRSEDPPKALIYYNQALKVWRRIGDKEGEAQTLTFISIAHSLLSDSRKALEAHERASPLIEGMRDEGAGAARLYNMGMVHLSSGEFQKAIDAFERVMVMARAAKTEKMLAHVPVLIGIAYYLLDEDQKALEQYTSALPMMKEIDNPSVEALAHAGIAMIERDRGNLDAARARMETALQIFQSLRGDLSREDLRISTFTSAQDFFEVYIDILMQQHRREPAAGHDAKAFQASELGRARSLLDSLTEARADIRQGANPELLRREQSLRQRLSLLAQRQRLSLLGGGGTEQQAQADREEIETLTLELQQVSAEIRQKSPAYAALTQPQPLTLKEVQSRVLDDDTLLLEYSLGDERSFLWAVTPSTIVSYVLPARAEIDAAVREVYELLNARARTVEGETSQQRTHRIAQADTAYPAAAARLSRMVLAPAAQQLGNKRLLIVADGTLQYIPVGALPDPNADAASFTPLILRHEVVSVLSASTLALLRRETEGRPLAPEGVAVLADPVFTADDVRLRRNPAPAPGSASSRRADVPRDLVHDKPAGSGSTTAGKVAGRIKRLPFSRQEAEAILKVAGPEGGMKVLDFAANRQFVTDPRLSGYRYLHFATHGFIDSDHPELSGVLLSMVDEKGAQQDGFLLAHEVYNLKLPAELVVLSACQTGLGREVRGEGLMGLTRGFMYAGAPRVVVSLWSVSDRATAELMARFYRGMLKEKLRPAAALRAAQLSLMRERGWESPFYWAAFTLQGEWR